tara:strand:+ start:49 stop:840 length:792 start_codon:yes stop_codon:yes gene_type:complete
MKNLFIILFAFISSFAYSQDYDFEELCIACSEANGFYCGDDPTNWTQYAPNGCVQTSWINDGWIDCVDATDENGAVPTPIEDCVPPVLECDTVYIDVPVIEYVDVFITDTVEVEVEVPFYIYETIIQLDTIIETEYITQIVVDTFEVEVMVPEYIYVTDTLWMEGALDTMYVDVIEYVDVIVMDTIIETEYIEIVVIDTIIEYIEVIQTEYIDCDTGMPCNSSIGEILEKSENDGRMYNILGQPIRRPESIYIQDGKIKYMLN